MGFFRSQRQETQDQWNIMVSRKILEHMNDVSLRVENLAQRLARISSSLEETRSRAEQEGELVASLDVMVGERNHHLAALTDTLKVFEALQGLLQQTSVRFSEVQTQTEAILHIGFKIRIVALNALVESAHAGEAGKGFAVVAEEIQRLSDEVDAVAKSVVTSAEAASAGVTEEVRQLDQMIAQTRGFFEEARSAYASLLDAFHQIAAMSRQTGEAARMQHQTVDELVRQTQGEAESLSGRCSELISLVTGHRVTDVSPSEAVSLLKECNAIDVRHSEEYNDELGHVEGTSLITLSATFDQAIAHLSRDRPLLLICRSGGRSSRAAQIALSVGFERVFNLKGGMIAWNQCRLPVASRSRSRG